MWTSPSCRDAPGDQSHLRANSGRKGLDLVEGGELPAVDKPATGSVIRHVVRVLPKQDGIFTVSATVSVDLANDSISRTYSIPVIVGDGLPERTAEDGGRGRACPPVRGDGSQNALTRRPASILCQMRRTLRPLADPPEAGPGGTTTLVRGEEAACGEDSPDLHAQLRAQLKEARLRSGAAAPDLGVLLRLISAHYDTIDQERRGIVQSMRLMADEARAMAHEAREQSSEHLQVILDHIKDVVLTVDEDGVIQTFNPTGERVFGYVEAEVVGQRIDQLIPKITTHGQETITQALHRLAAS